ncbi:MAG: chitinase, partial [Thermoplasmata archaeon]
DPDGEIVFYRWNFGDGSGEILDPNPSHTYQKEGTYIVTLTVIDNNGTSDTKTTEVEISKGKIKNTPPISNPGGPYSGNINEPIQFDASGSYDPDGEIVEYTWDFGDGSVGYGVNPTHSYSKSGIFEVKLTVKDDDGKASSSTTYVKISEKKKTPGFDTTIIIFALLITSLISLMRKR